MLDVSSMRCALQYPEKYITLIQPRDVADALLPGPDVTAAEAAWLRKIGIMTKSDHHKPINFVGLYFIALMNL